MLRPLMVHSCSHRRSAIDFSCAQTTLARRLCTRPRMLYALTEHTRRRIVDYNENEETNY